MRNSIRAALFMGIAVAALTLSERAHAADITDVLDAFDQHIYDGKVVEDYIDFAIEPSFVQTVKRAKITREANCQQGSERCPDESTIIINKELRYERIVNQMDIDIRLGMFRDLEFFMKLPIVFSDQRKLKYAQNAGAACEFDVNPDNPKCVDETNSTVDPSDARIAADAGDGGSFDTYRYFDVPTDASEYHEGTERSGLDDITFGIAWAPWNEERHVDPTNEVWGRNHGRSALRLAFEYTAPTAGVARAADHEDPDGNEDVGDGLHKFVFDIATSRRYQYVDPYVGFRFGFQVPADDTLFLEYAEDVQDRVEPGPWGEVTMGVEFIPWENITEEFQQHFRIDLWGKFGYVGEGRNYSPFFDALGDSNCQGMSLNQTDLSVNPSASNPECGWIGQRWSNAGFENIGKIDPNNAEFDPDHPLFSNGTASYEGYATLMGGLGFVVQPIQYVKITADLALGHETEHFMTFAKAGKDKRGRVAVDPNDPDAGTRPADGTPKDGTVSFDDIEERNPVYNPTYDAVGRRFRIEETTVFSWRLGLVFQF